MASFIGRKATPCRKCRGSDHWVNRMGGIVCSSCNPPKNPETDVKARLTIENGVWVDPANRFDMIDPPAAEAVKREISTPVTQAVVSGGKAVPPATVPAAVGRGPRGELSLKELDLFGSDLVWSSDDPYVKLLPARAVSMRRPAVESPRRSRRGLNSDGRVASPVLLAPGDERPVVRIVGGGEIRPGCEVDVLRRLATFGGYAEPGPATVDSVGRDTFGRPVVTLCRGGKVIVSGLEV